MRRALGKIHIPVAVIGILGYALIAGLALSKQYWLTLQAAEIGFACAAFLSFLEAYVIESGAFIACTRCVLFRRSWC